MEHYIAKGYTFPDQDWWEEKKADVSFLYTVEEEPDSASSGQSFGSRQNEEDAGATGKRERSEHAVRAGSKMRLDNWIEEARHDMGPASSKITSLAGYVNLAYPIMKTLTKKRRGYYEEMEVKDKDLRLKIDRVAANLRRAAEAMERIRTTVDYARVPTLQAEPLRKLLLQKSSRIVEKCELVNMLMNMIKNSSANPEKQRGESGQSKIYGSSVDLI